MGVIAIPASTAVIGPLVAVQAIFDFAGGACAPKKHSSLNRAVPLGYGGATKNKNCYHNEQTCASYLRQLLLVLLYLNAGYLSESIPVITY